MKEQLMRLIDRHNGTVARLETLDIPVPEGKMFRAMELWHNLSCEGADITHMARKYGIDAKCNMQSGGITVLGGIEVPDAYSELSAYDEEHHASLFRDGHEPDAGTYEIVFAVEGTRYYCYVNGCDTYLEALGLFFKNHPHVTYGAVELCEEV